MRKIIAALFALGLGGSAYAAVSDYPTTVRVPPTSYTLSTTASLVLNANPTRQTLSIQDTDATISVCYSFTTVTPVCGAQGTFTITAGQTFFWPRSSPPSNALYMIAASGAPVVSVNEGN